MDAKRPRVTVAMADHDRTRALVDGRIGVEGVDATFLTLPIEQTIRRMLSHDAFDVAEMSLSSAVSLAAQGHTRFVALPIFPSRMFRHSAIFVAASSALEDLADLRGRTIAAPFYARLTAAVWMRGILEDDYGVAPTDMKWIVQEGLPVGTEDRIPIELLDVRIESVGWESDLELLLESGDIDALMVARRPNGVRTGSIRRLLARHREVEENYFRRTGMFPIMHCLVVRRDLYDAHPALAPALFKAFVKAKSIAQAAALEIDVARYSMAWWTDALEAEQRVIGPGEWAYGIPGNEATLERFLDYCFRQGITTSRLSIEELFPPALHPLDDEGP